MLKLWLLAASFWMPILDVDALVRLPNPDGLS